ncbi:RNA-processing protein [Candidatus Woesearchaeota archaeon]|nr:RNA-processing protein [Candidatus Woesearchaeota archaeon]
MTSQKIKDIASEEDLEFSYELKIPKERVAVLIGKKGETKKKIEETAKVKLKIDSGEGDVIITGKDSIGLYSAREIVHAVARGFNPEIALQLLKQDYMMETIDLRDYAPTKNAMMRLKGRVIGMEGKSRRVIEELTETHISVYGKTISIIGEITLVGVAKNAVEKLLEGGMHAGVFRELEKKRRDMKLRKIEQSFDITDE